MDDYEWINQTHFECCHILRCLYTLSNQSLDNWLNWYSDKHWNYFCKGLCWNSWKLFCKHINFYLILLLILIKKYTLNYILKCILHQFKPDSEGNAVRSSTVFPRRNPMKLMSNIFSLSFLVTCLVSISAFMLLNSFNDLLLFHTKYSL